MVIKTIRSTASLLQAGDGENPLSEPQQPSYTLSGVLNALSKLLHTFYTVFGGQNALSKALQAPYTLCFG